MNRKLLLPLIFLLLALLACRAASHTVIEENGAGLVTTVFEIPLAEDEDPDDVECDLSQDAPPGATVKREVEADMVRCLWEAPFENLEGLRAIYESTEDLTTVECLALLDNRLIYDVELEVSDDQASTVEGLVVEWSLTVPGPIESHNADAREGQTLTWLIEGQISQRSFQVNLDDEGQCPTDPLALTLHVTTDGTGHATLTAPVLPTGRSDTQQWIDSLRDSGWQVSDPEPGAASFDTRRSWESETAIESIPAAVPPLTGSDTRFKLGVKEDEASGFRQFNFSGRIDLRQYASYWEGINPKLATPAFEFELFPAGTIDAISGDWTDNVQLRVDWQPGSEKNNFPIIVQSVYDPQLSVELSEEELEANLEQLGSRFTQEIPAGQLTKNPSFIQSTLLNIFPPGTVNNMTNWTTWACGDYQGKVIEWLDGIRTSADPEERAELAGLDYGPVQAYAGGHQAVVVFPRGTDWRETGTVLDPWPEQRPKIFTMDEWRDRFSWGHGVGEGGERFPHMRGGSPAYPTNIGKQRLHTRRIGVNSPVSVLVTSSDGRRLGMLPDGTFVNEIEGADFYPEPKGSGEHQWYFGLPEGSYEMAFTGTADGDIHVLAADENEALVTYGPQPITQGGSASLAVDPAGLEQPFELPSGELVAPIEVSDENVGELDFGQPAHEESSPEGTELPAPSNRLPLLIVLILCTWGPAAALWTAVALRFRR